MRPALLLALLSSPLAAQNFDFYARGPYRPAVPRPEAILGYAAGEQHTMYAQLQRYLDTLVASAPERVRIERWGQTAERRPIRALIISDAANLARLDQIRAEIAELTDPRKTTPARAADIAARDPVIVLFQYSVHVSWSRPGTAFRKRASVGCGTTWCATWARRSRRCACARCRGWATSRNTTCCSSQTAARHGCAVSWRTTAFRSSRPG